MPYSLYVIELSRDVRAEVGFARRNHACREDKPCVYVGQTALTPEKRFAQHRAGYKSNRYAHRYGVRLRPKLVADRGPFATRDEALEAEAALAERLRRRGYGVWSG
jgi:predicted GIY-YIG superfamily endonuclease